MMSEGSCDTENMSNDVENSQELIYCILENLSCNDISQYYILDYIF